eukprot:3506033-Amphidinium_carterae.1
MSQTSFRTTLYCAVVSAAEISPNHTVGDRDRRTMKVAGVSLERTQTHPNHNNLLGDQDSRQPQGR